MEKNAAADVVIFGGGVAGLWLLNRLRQRGLSVFLFETNALGSGQTNKSQGILHGGMKYALDGVFNAEAQAIADMPARWKAALKNQGEMDLSHVPILSEAQCLFSPHKITSKFTGFLAKKTLKSDVLTLSADTYPDVFKHPAFKGEVCSLDEIVIDVPALVRELTKNNQDAIFKMDAFAEDAFTFTEDKHLQSVKVSFGHNEVNISAQQFVFAAGKGNADIVKHYSPKEVAMQLRPLHMVLVKLPFHSPLYAHCLGLSSRPRVTITTHYQHDGSTIWYLGGMLAEDGVNRDSADQVAAAQKELQNLFPWLNLEHAEFATFRVNRAESQQKSGFKPETCYANKMQNVTIAWPTKLVLAPKLADDIIAQFDENELTPHFGEGRELRAWPMPPFATPIWEELFCKNVS